MRGLSQLGRPARVRIDEGCGWFLRIRFRSQPCRIASDKSRDAGFLQMRELSLESLRLEFEVERRASFSEEVRAFVRPKADFILIPSGFETAVHPFIWPDSICATVLTYSPEVRSLPLALWNLKGISVV